MLKVSFKFDEASKKYIETLPEKVKGNLVEGIKKAFFFAENKAKEGFDVRSGPPNPPPGPLVVRSGHLRRSIKSGTDPKTATGWLGTNVLYGKIHELGSGKIPARPFLRPAMSGRNLDRMVEIIKEELFGGL